MNLTKHLQFHLPYLSGASPQMLEVESSSFCKTVSINEHQHPHKYLTNAIHTNGASSLIKIWYIHITNLIFYLYFRDTAAHLAQLIPLCCFLLQRFPFDFTQGFPWTFHKDFLRLFTRIQLFRICFQSILQLLIFTLPLLISGLGSCGEGEGTWWWLELLLVHKEFCIKGAFLSRIFKVYKFSSNKL